MSKILAAHRYYIWANRLRDYFDRLDQPPDDSQILFASDYGLFLSYWYGALYVVIEAWQELHLDDPVIDNLLRSDYVRLLRRYRNATFHFQKQYSHEKYFDLISSKGSAAWIRTLNKELGRYFLEHLPHSETDML